MDGTPRPVTSTVYSFTYNGSNYLSGAYYVISATSQTASYVNASYSALSIAQSIWSMDVGNNAAMVKLEYTDESDPTEIYSSTSQMLTKLNDVVTFGGNTYSGVSSVSIASVKNPTTFSYTYRNPTGSYADPTDGWSTRGNQLFYCTYTFTNNYIRMMVHFVTPEYFTLRPQSDSGTIGSTLTITYDSNGTLYVGSESFGNYDTIMIEMSTESTKITGLIGGWPSFGAIPEGYNTITLDPLITTNIELVRIYSQYSNAVYFRVDSANIQAGFFPTTKNKDLVLNTLFPGKSFRLKFNSVGIYGTELATAGSSGSVDNGILTIRGYSIPIKGMTVSYLYNTSTAKYDIYIDSYFIASNSRPALWFGGEWSVTITLDIVEKETVTSQEWAAGQFAFDTQESFSGALVFAAAAVFIGVGLYGARSGNKIGLLLIVCGGVLLIAINLI